VPGVPYEAWSQSAGASNADPSQAQADAVVGRCIITAVGAFENIVSDAESEARVARQFARRNQWLYYILGGLAFVSGSVAGLSAATDWLRVVTAIAGFAAAFFAGLQTVFDPKSKADSNWDKVRDLRALLHKAEIIGEQEGRPTAADLMRLNDELTTISKG
jgi:hypothetical protein